MDKDEKVFYVLSILFLLIVVFVITYFVGNIVGVREGRCNVICDKTSNVAVCDSGLTVCKTGKVQWRKEGQP